jgi:Leucine-rich repeat (LRR) protein
LDRLTNLNLDWTKVTDEGIQHLRNLKTLTSLNVRNTSVTKIGLGALNGLPLVRIGYGNDMKEVAEQASQVAEWFPDIEVLSLPRHCNPVLIQCSAVAKAWPKLKRLEINSRDFTDEACTGLPQLAALQELDMPYSPITDTGAAHIATLKKLFWLSLNESKITDAALETLARMKPLKYIKLPKPGNGITAEGLAKFKKQRPDVKVE